MAATAPVATVPVRPSPAHNRAKLALVFGIAQYAILAAWTILQHFIIPKDLPGEWLLFGIAAALAATALLFGATLAAIGFGASVLASKYRWLGLAAIFMTAIPFLGYTRIFA